MSASQALLQFYRRFLSKFRIFVFARALGESLFRTYYRLACIVMNTHAMREFAVVPLAEAKRRGYATTYDFISSKQLSVPAPQVIFSDPKICGQISVTGLDGVHLNTPKIELSCFRRATVIGGMSVVLCNAHAIQPDCINSEFDTTPAEVFGVSRKLRADLIQIYLRREPRILSAAASLLGQSTRNYAHWLTETLPKLLVLDQFSSYGDYPLLVDANLHPNHYEGLNLMNLMARPIELVGRWEAVTADTLLDISPPAYEPYIPHRMDHKISTQVNSFSPPVLRMLRETAVRRVTNGDPEESARKVYLSRSETSNNLRRLVNAGEVEALASAQGYLVLAPHLMNFADQVRACKHAQVIMAPIGAALANMIFAPPGCTVIVLAPWLRPANYSYYLNLAHALGHQLIYVVGRSYQQSAGHPVHRDYMVGLDGVRQAIKSTDLKL